MERSAVDSEHESVAEVVMRLDSEVVAARRLHHSANRTCGNKLSVYGGDSHLTLDVDVHGLETGMHILEASLLMKTGSAAAAHTVSFWWVQREEKEKEDPWVVDEHDTRHVPLVKVLRHSLRETQISQAHEMVVWLVLDNFQVGVDGSLVVVDNDARETMVYPSILEWGPELAQGHLRRLWPIAQVSCQDGECTVGRILTQSTVMPCAQGSRISWPGASADLDLTLFEMVVTIPPDPDQSCHQKHFTISLRSLSGMPVEETSALSQWVVHLHCGPDQVPRGSLPAGEELGIHALMNRRWREAVWWHHRDKFSRQNARGNPTCYWYAGPLAGELCLMRGCGLLVCDQLTDGPSQVHPSGTD
jgi:hypothetical protein